MCNSRTFLVDYLRTEYWQQFLASYHVKVVDFVLWMFENVLEAKREICRVMLLLFQVCLGGGAGMTSITRRGQC